MKITKNQLRRIIKEELALAIPSERESVAGHSKEVSEVGMSINQLQAVSVTALELSEMIRQMNHVPEWAQGKIAVMLEDLNDIRGYMLGKSVGQ